MADADFVFLLLFTTKFFFVIFLKLGLFEREGVGAAFVHFDSFNACRFTVSFSAVFEKLLPREPDSAFK